MAYFTYTDLETYTGNSYTAAEQTQLTNVIIPAIESAIENFTGRKFGVSGDAEVSKYYFGVQTTREGYSPRGRSLNAPHRTRELEIDDFYSISSVVEIDENDNETTLTLSELEQLPLNEEWTDRLYHTEGAFVGYKYKVTGVYGTTGSVPEDIKYAAMQLASSALSQVGDVNKETIEGYSYEKSVMNSMYENQMVQSILGKWKKVLV